MRFIAALLAGVIAPHAVHAQTISIGCHERLVGLQRFDSSEPIQMRKSDRAQTAIVASLRKEALVPGEVYLGEAHIAYTGTAPSIGWQASYDLRTRGFSYGKPGGKSYTIHLAPSSNTETNAIEAVADDARGFVVKVYRCIVERRQ
jgi:hypothetical protein